MDFGMETELVEFKKSTGELKEGIISIVSILNKHQGSIPKKNRTQWLQ